MARTRREKAEEVLERATRGPSHDLTFTAFDVPGLALTPGQRLALEASLDDRYRLWASTWVLPTLRELLAADLEPRPRTSRPHRGQAVLPGT